MPFFFFHLHRFVIVSDANVTTSTVLESMDLWPEEYKKRVTVKDVPVSYPADRQYMKYVGATCCTARLFIPSMLPEYDAVIYLDTDFVFMRPPEDLWAILKDFDPRQLAGMADAHNSYEKRKLKPVRIFF